MQVDVTDKAKYNSNKTKDQPVEIKHAPLQTSNIEEKNCNKKNIEEVLETVDNNMQLDMQINNRKRNHTAQKIIFDTDEITVETKKDIMTKEELGTLDYGSIESLEKDKVFVKEQITNKSNKKIKKYENIFNSVWAPRSIVNESYAPIKDTHIHTWTEKKSSSLLNNSKKS
ncbi:39922_t:CDS:1, partial [Gigaspora margarita]